MADVPMTAVMVTFDEVDDAKKWLKHAHDQEYKVSEGIVVERDEDGKVHQHLANLPGILSGAGVGAIIGVILGVIFPPAALGEALAAAVIGAGGAIVGAGGVAVKDELIDRNAFKGAADSLKPGQSALVVVMASDFADKFAAEITGYDTLTSQELGVK